MTIELATAGGLQFLVLSLLSGCVAFLFFVLSTITPRYSFLNTKARRIALSALIVTAAFGVGAAGLFWL